jgi:hypothetical protein
MTPLWHGHLTAVSHGELFIRTLNNLYCIEAAR